MRTKKTKFLMGLTLSLTVTAAFAGVVEDQIRNRQSAYGFLGWNIGKIKAQAVDHPDTYNKEQVIAAANAVAAVANSGLLELYGAGTDKGTGWKPSRLKSDYFEKQSEIKDIEATFIKEANELQEVAQNGDVAAIKTQFGKVGAACKSCHDVVRVKE
jgi:cytochrome c556